MTQRFFAVIRIQVPFEDKKDKKDNAMIIC